MGEGATETSVTHDAFYGGRLRLTQTAQGHRSGTDAVLLAAAVPRDVSGLVYDAGAGVGAVGLGIAFMCPGATVRLIENDPICCTLAADNIVANRLEGRAAVADCDLLSVEARRRCLPDLATLVVTNPPFYDRGNARHSPDPDRRAAHVLVEGVGLHDWLLACLDLLAPKGTLVVLHRAVALPAILQVISGSAGGISMMAVHPRAGLPARRCLVRAVKGSRAPFQLAAPFILHEGEKFTSESDAVHRGDAILPW